MAAPERKYTDADVRADMELTELALEYLDTYAGDFDPLVRAQDVLLRGGRLTTSQIRVVLNCMRHDWNIADQMPTPEATVIEMPVRQESAPPQRKRKPYQPNERNCEKAILLQPHPGHALWNNGYCSGVKNGREAVLVIPARVKTPFVMARSGKMVHLVGEGSNYHWYPNQYGKGFTLSNRHVWGTLQPELRVKTLCKHPSWITKPTLLPEIPLMFTNDMELITLCKYCIKERDEKAAGSASTQDG